MAITIKAYNRAVEPNTIQGQVQTSSNPTAYGENTNGSQAIIAGLGEAQKQLQGYVDDQINLSVIDAKNQYEAGMNDLLNNPKTGLLNQQDMNALDVVQKYQEGESKLRNEVLAGLPNYKKAQDTFLNMANEVNNRNTGQMMKYQYAKDMEHRELTWNTFVDNETDNLVQTNNAEGLFTGFNRITATAYALYSNIYGKDKIDVMIKERNTEMANNVLNNLVASSNASDYDKALNILEKISPFISDAKLTTMRSMLQKRKHDNYLLQIAKTARINHPNDPKAQEKEIREKAQKTIMVGGSNSGNSTVDQFIDAAHEFGVDPRKLLSVGMRETGGDTIDGMNMAAGGGFGQITDETAQAYGLDEKFPNWQTDSRQNIRAAAFILKKKTEEHGGDEWAGVRAYNGDGPMADEYLSQVQTNYAGLENMDFSGGNGAASFENNLIQGFQNAADIPQNGPNGCAEEALSALSWANPWAANAYQKGLFNVEAMANDAKANGIKEIDYDPNQLAIGDLVIYTTKEGEYGHTVVYDGHGGFYGNSSSANGGAGGKVHGTDINIPGMTPAKILKTGASDTGGAMRQETIQVYDESEIQKALSLAAQFDAQEARATKMANDSLVRQGLLEMQQLHDSGNLDITSYQAIADKYGANNPDVYSTLKSSISTYVSVRASGGIYGGGSGRGGRSGGGYAGAGKADMLVLKSLFGQNGIETLSDIQNYCANKGIVLTPSQVNTLAKAAEQYQTGTGEYKPMYEVTAEQIQDASGIGKWEFKGNMAVIQQLIRAAAVQYRAQHNGEEPSLNQLIQFGVNAVTKDAAGYSQAQLRAAGILSVTPLYNGYNIVKDWNHNTYYIYTDHLQDILTGQTTLADVVEQAEEAQANGTENDTDKDTANTSDTGAYRAVYDTSSDTINNYQSSEEENKEIAESNTIGEVIENRLEDLKNTITSWW